MAPLGSGPRVCGPGGLAVHLPRLLRACFRSVRSSRSRWAGPHVAGCPRMPALRVCGLVATVLAVRTGEHLGRETAPCSTTSSGCCLVLGQHPSWLAENRCPVLPSPQVNPQVTVLPASMPPGMSATHSALGELSPFLLRQSQISLGALPHPTSAPSQGTELGIRGHVPRT